MKCNILLIGFGVIGTEALSKIVKDYNGKKILNISIVDKNINNIPGGIAYSKANSKFGFFNNPLRLSNPEFIKWVKTKKNIIKIKNFIKENKDFNLVSWLNKNKDFNNARINKLNEIYLPRLTYSFFLEEKIINILKKIKKKNININLVNSELLDIKINENNEDYTCLVKKKSNYFKFILNNNSFKLKKIIKKNYSILTDVIIVGNGLLPPKIIKQKSSINTQNYIWDFYSEGGTQNLLKKIKKELLFKKSIKLLFIGNKAGLLETMPEIEILSQKIKNKIKIVCFSPNLLSLERAELSNKYKDYKFKFFKKDKIEKINKAKKIYLLLNKEFEYAKSTGFHKYDVWTLILKKKYLNKIYSSLSKIEKKIYNDEIFSKIRNITRYTYPNTIDSKNKLEDMKILSYLTDKVIKLNMHNKYIEAVTSKGSKIKGDIVVNVSGPVSLIKITNEVSFLNSLKRISNEFGQRGFFADNNFAIAKKIYAPGIISSNFNPNRFTIIKAITFNTYKSVNKIIKTLN
jgi:hypothetical protein